MSWESDVPYVLKGMIKGLRIFSLHWGINLVESFATCRRGVEQLVARWAHNPKAGGSNPPPATTWFTTY